MKRVLVVVGTRPEAVKLAPVIRAAAAAADLELTVTWTGQHAGLLAQHAAALGVHAPQGPARGAESDALRGQVAAALAQHRPDAVLSQGDTASVVAAAEVSRERGVPFIHLEAGLRSGSFEHPWPEECNRVRVARLATLHLAPTVRAAENLFAEDIPRHSVVVTGNTIVDAALHTLGTLALHVAPSDRLRPFESPRTRVLFTHHRRESFPRGAAAVLGAVAAFARAAPEVEVVMPTHPNPALDALLEPVLATANVRRLPPLDHRELLWLLRRCRFAITDSGGIQEEAPSVGVPVLVTRHTTERPEALEYGWAKLVGWRPERIEQSSREWLHDEAVLLRAQPRFNPYGDGRAATRCVQALRCLLGLSLQTPAAWAGPAIAA